MKLNRAGGGDLECRVARDPTALAENSWTDRSYPTEAGFADSDA